MDQNTERFIYADRLCVTFQESTFETVEANLTLALDKLLLYYKCNHLQDSSLLVPSQESWSQPTS